MRAPRYGRRPLWVLALGLAACPSPTVPGPTAAPEPPAAPAPSTPAAPAPHAELGTAPLSPKLRTADPRPDADEDNNTDTKVAVFEGLVSSAPNGSASRAGDKSAGTVDATRDTKKTGGCLQRYPERVNGWVSRRAVRCLYWEHTGIRAGEQHKGNIEFRQRLVGPGAPRFRGPISGDGWIAVDDRVKGKQIYVACAMPRASTRWNLDAFDARTGAWLADWTGPSTAAPSTPDAPCGGIESLQGDLNGL